MKKFISLIIIIFSISCSRGVKFSSKDPLQQTLPSMTILTFFNDSVGSKWYEAENYLDAIRAFIGAQTESNSIWLKKYESNGIVVDWQVNRLALKLVKNRLRKEKLLFFDAQYDQDFFNKNPDGSLYDMFKELEKNLSELPDYYLVLVQKPTTLPQKRWFKNSESESINNFNNRKNSLLTGDTIFRKPIHSRSYTRFIGYENKINFSVTLLNKPIFFTNTTQGKVYCGVSFDLFLFDRNRKELIAFVPANQSSALKRLGLSDKEYMKKSFVRFLEEEENEVIEGCFSALEKSVNSALNKSL